MIDTAPTTREAAIEACRASGVADPEDVARRSWPELFVEHSKPTAGVWTPARSGFAGTPSIVSTINKKPVSVAQFEREADRDLCIEAGTVLHETGLTPRELQTRCDSAEKQRDELLQLLRFIQSGLARKKIKDVSVIPQSGPGAVEADLTTLSAMVNAAIASVEVSA